MPPERGPAVHRRKLGAELRRLRDEAGLKIEDVAEVLECSPSKISRLETGKGIPKTRDVRDMLTRYGVTDTKLRDRLLQWARAGQQTGWWQEFSDVLHQDTQHMLEAFVARETDASRTSAFQISLFHGLVQTEEYARAVVRAVLPDLGEHEVDRVIELRLRRQEVLQRDVAPLQLRLVLDEAVLHRPIGGPAVMAGQLARLLADSERPNIAVRVLPFTAGVHPSIVGSFEISEFDDDHEHDFVSIENMGGNTHLENSAEVEKYRTAFDEVTAKSLDTEVSAERIESAMSRFSKMEDSADGNGR